MPKHTAARPAAALVWRASLNAMRNVKPRASALVILAALAIGAAWLYGQGGSEAHLANTGSSVGPGVLIGVGALVLAGIGLVVAGTIKRNKADK